MKIVLCGIGNEEAGDDCFGPYVINHIKETPTLRKINCGMVPENYLNKIIDHDPDLVVFLDTLQNDNNEAVTIMKNDELLDLNPNSISSHNLPFSAIYRFIRAHCQADVFFVGVRPHSYHDMSPETGFIAEKIIEKFHVLDTMGVMNIIQIYEILSHILR